MNRLKQVIFYLSLFVTLWIYSCGSDQIQEIDCSISGPSIELDEVVEAGCLPTGQVTLIASGDNGQLLYSLDGINFQSSPTFSNLSSDTYTITVVDEAECTDVITVSIGNESSDLTFTAETTTGGCETDEGTITVTASGGAGGYTYRLGTDVFGPSNTFANVSGGVYNVSVQDAEGCIHNSSVRVQSGVSFVTAVKPILEANCNVATCHGEDPDIPKLATIAEVQGAAQKIRSEVEGGTMPPEDELSQNQIDQILCWIGDGAPDN